MRNRNATAYRFLTPYLMIFAVFWVWPIISSFLISFQATRTVPWRFAPAFNWGRLIGDPAFFNALKNTLLILVIQVPVMIALAMIMAVLLNSPLLKARGLFRFAFQRQRRLHGQAVALREFVNGARFQRHATPLGTRRLGIDGGNVVPLGDQLRQRGHRELRRAHKCEPQNHLSPVRFPIRP